MLVDEVNIKKCVEMLTNNEQIEILEFIKSFSNGNVSKLYIEELMVESLIRIGEEWEEGDLALTQVYMSGVICEDIIKRVFKLKNRLPNNTQRIGTVVLEDHHSLGIKLVQQILNINGYEFIDLGVALTIDEIVTIVHDKKIEILLVSVLMLPSALHIEKLRKRIGKHVKIIVGGAPFRLDMKLWKKVGADGFGLLASNVVQVIEGVISHE